MNIKQLFQSGLIGIIFLFFANATASAATVSGTAEVTCITGSSILCGSNGSLVATGFPGAIVSGPGAGGHDNSVSVLSSASALFGSLKALASVSYNQFIFDNTWDSVWFESQGHSDMSDTLTVNKGGMLAIPVTISGSDTLVNDRGTFSLNGNNGDFSFNINGSCLNCINSFGNYTVFVPIPSSGQIDLSARLSFDIGSRIFSNSFSNQPFTELHTLDISHTVEFGPMSVVDSNGNKIVDAIITSESGHNYMAPVPLPSGIWLFSLALSIFGVIHRRR